MGDGSGSGIVPNALAPGSITRGAPFSGLGGTLFANMGGNSYQLGLEPTIYLDELANYQNHLNEIRRINMGDDIADSAGYGLYLIRMPVSIQPGECTLKGHGAVLTATVRHDFAPDFLATTFRNLVINDLVDQLTPILYEMIRSETLNSKTLPGIKNHEDARIKYRNIMNKVSPSDSDKTRFMTVFMDEKSASATSSQGKSVAPAQNSSPAGGAADQVRNMQNIAQNSNQRWGSIYTPMTRMNDRSYPIAATEMDNVFIMQNLVMLALNAKDAMQSATPRADDVRSFLRREIESSYDIISQLYGADDRDSATIVKVFEQQVESIAKHVRNREYHELESNYVLLAGALPGQMRYIPKESDRPPPDRSQEEDHQYSLVNPMTILSYAIAVEAGLLDQQLRVDMKRVFKMDGGDCSLVDAMRFYSASPAPEVEQTFQEYVKKRWPVITFAVHPVVDEQNIADASSISRDLQLALAFGFSTGQINFQQLLQFQRRIQFDAETIALNRTITSFSHGNETFGFRFTPRYQNPPPERSNLQVIYNQLIKGGPGRNYQINNSKLEAGQRELTVIVIMPSFLQSIQMDLTGNWFPLDDPDQMKIRTPRMIEQGRKVVELDLALASIHDHKHYRAGDLQRLQTRVRQIESMLPMQTRQIRIPYENTLGGFQLFQQGTTSLVPQLDAFEGVEMIDPDKEADIFLFGKHFSVQETQVVVGGKYLSGANLDVQRSLDAAKGSLDAAQAGASAAQAASQAAGQTQSTSQGTGQETGAAGAGGPGSPGGAGTSQSSTASNTASTAAAAAQTASDKLNQAAQGHIDAAKQSVNAAKLKAGAGTAGSALAPAAAGPDAAGFEIISREVMRVNIPAGVLTTEISGAEGQKPKKYVEVFVATPNGISNRLLIPVKPAAKRTTTTATPLGYSITEQSLTLTYKGEIERDNQGTITTAHFVFDSANSDASQSLTITLDEATGIVPEVIDAIFVLALPGEQQPLSLNVAVPAIPGKGSQYIIRGNQFIDFANKLVQLPNVKQLLQDLKRGEALTASVQLTPCVQAQGFVAVPKNTTNQVKVNFQFTLVNPPAAGASPEVNPQRPPGIVPTPPAPGREGVPRPQPQPSPATRLPPPRPWSTAARPAIATPAAPPGRKPSTSSGTSTANENAAGQGSTRRERWSWLRPPTP